MKQEIIDKMQELYDRDGTLTPDAVVTEALDPESPLHNSFDWNDESAAHKYRTQQARVLIGRVQVNIKKRNVKIRSVAYVRDPDVEEKQQGYVATTTLQSDKGKARRALLQELQRAESSMQRAYDLADAVGLASEVDKLLRRIRNIKSAA